jgi:hypothetical protein
VRLALLVRQGVALGPASTRSSCAPLFVGVDLVNVGRPWCWRARRRGLAPVEVVRW